MHGKKFSLIRFLSDSRYLSCLSRWAEKALTTFVPIRINSSVAKLLRFVLVMERIALQNIPYASFNRKMRDLFIDLVDITSEFGGKGCLKAIPTNCGYVFFWYGWLNKKALIKYYPEYVGKEKVKEIKKLKKENAAAQLQNQISDFLFSIVREHPDTIDGGHAEVHLALLTPKLKQMTVAEAAKAMQDYAEKLSKLEKFTRRYLGKKAGRVVEEIEARFGVIDFVTPQEVAKFSDEYFWDDECGYIELSHRRLGCEVQVRVHFDGDDTLSQVVDRIDGVIAPIKSEIDYMFRFGKPGWPF